MLPSFGAIDPAHPLGTAGGLIAWVDPNPTRASGIAAIDLASQARYPFAASYLGGSPKWADGPAGSIALQLPAFDGVPGHDAGRINLGYSLATRVSSAFTIALRAFTNASGALECFCGEGIYPPDVDVGTIFRLSDGSYWARVTNNAGTQATVNAGSWPASKWVSVAITYNGSSVVLYADGAPLGSASLTGPVYATGTGYAIGARGTDAYSSYGNAGKVASWQLWNRALSAAEVALLHDQARRGYPDLLRRAGSILTPALYGASPRRFAPVRSAFPPLGPTGRLIA